MITIETPEATAERVVAATSVRGETAARYLHDIAVYAIRADREHVAAVLEAQAAEWKTMAPASSGGYVAALEELANRLGSEP